MRAECQFAKAGQGLFYNGILIDDRGKRFSFVYDCGTLPWLQANYVLNKSIWTYKDFIKNRLDLLFISHFHQDHISHIPELLSNISVGTVVIPYIDPDMRLLLAAQYDGIETDGDRISFFREPSKWLLDRGAEKVITIRGADDFGEENKNEQGIKPNPEKDPEYLTISYNSRNSSENSETIECEGWCSLTSWYYAWEFKTFNPYPEKYSVELIDSVRAILNENDGDFRKILRDKSLREKLKKLLLQKINIGICLRI